MHARHPAAPTSPAPSPALSPALPPRPQIILLRDAALSESHAYEVLERALAA